MLRYKRFRSTGRSSLVRWTRRTLSWFVEYFNSDESIIEFQDKENGKIAGKYTFQHGNGIYYYMIKQTISIDIKNEKLKLIFLNPVYKTIR